MNKFTEIHRFKTPGGEDLVLMSAETYKALTDAARGHGNQWQAIPIEVRLAIDGGTNPIKAFRLYHGLTQTQLGEQVGTVGIYISQLETGTANGSWKLLTKIATFFGVGVQLFLPQARERL